MLEYLHVPHFELDQWLEKKKVGQSVIFIPWVCDRRWLES